jgi:cell division protein FtsZ
MEEGSVKVTIVATGFENKMEKSKELKALNDTQQAIKRERIMHLKKAVGGYEGQEDFLDIPTYIRHQMD